MRSEASCGTKTDIGGGRAAGFTARGHRARQSTAFFRSLLKDVPLWSDDYSDLFGVLKSK